MRNAYKNPYINISTDEFTINLLELTNGQTLELANLEIPVGEYDRGSLPGVTEKQRRQEGISTPIHYRVALT